jgi:hypothetical protein
VTRAAALALLFAGAAQAAPPDARLAFTGQKPRIEKIDTGFSAVEVDPPALVRAELLPTGELLLEPRGAGVARVFLFARRLVRVLEVAFDAALPAPSDAVVPAVCGDAREAKLSTAACYAAWRDKLLHASAAELPALTWELDGLRAQAAAVQAALDAAGIKLTAQVSAYGLKLKGDAEDPARRKALMAAWPAVIGPLRIDE